MKASLTEYVKVLSGNELATLEEIISKKYRKFMKFFLLVKDYSESISSMKYNLTESTKLDVEITMKKTIKKEMNKDIIQKMYEDGYHVDSKVNGKKIKLIITYDESQ